ncbi:hypothetical protein DITRI_Ditri02bG0167500 [Diplodiscus trichospermus]
MASLSSWSDLPQEILEIIFEWSKDPIDILQCGAACKSWLRTGLQIYQKFLPLYFILSGKDLNGHTLLNLFTQETRKIQPADAKGNLISCSCNGWLLISDPNTVLGRMRLLNIFSRTQINLPRFTSLQRVYFWKYCSRIPLNWKLLLTECPSNSDCIVFLLRDAFAGLRTISIWKTGQKKWSDLKFSRRKIYDAILWKGKFYAIFRVSVHRNFMIRCNYQMKLEAVVAIPEICHCYVFVKSLNDNLLIVGYDVNHERDNFIKIWEFDDCATKFREVNDLGGCALFISPNSSYLLSKAGNVVTWFKANCIYIFWHWHNGYLVCDLETRNSKIVPCPFFSKMRTGMEAFGSIWMPEAS